MTVVPRAVCRLLADESSFTALLALMPSGMISVAVTVTLELTADRMMLLAATPR